MRHFFNIGPRAKRLAFAIVSAFCLAVSFRFMSGDNDAASPSIIVVALVAVWGAFLHKTARVPAKRDIPLIVVACLFALMTLVGNALVRTKDTFVLIGDGGLCALSLLSWAALSVFFYSLIEPLFAWLLDPARKKATQPTAPASRHAKVFWRLLPFVFLVAWLPYIIINLPGSTCPDVTYMLEQFLGYRPYSTHHPLQATFVYGPVFWLGKLIGGTDNSGLFALVVFQTACFMFACTYEVKTIAKVTASRRWVVITSLFFALVPFFGCFCQMAVKDTLFGAVFLVYATLFALYVRDPGSFSASRGRMAALLLSAFAVGVLRNNGLYIVFLSLPFLALLHDGWRTRLRALLPLALAVALIPLSNLGCQMATGATSGSIREALSLPFQQTARYALLHQDDIEDWERDAIGSVLDYENLPDLYDWNNADRVKNTYESSGSLPDYFAAWVSQGLRHPLSYINAALLQTYGYWYPMQGHQDYGQEITYFNIIPTKDFDWHKLNPFHLSEAELEELNDSPNETMEMMRGIPFLGLLLGDGFYFWELLLEGALLVYAGRRRSLILLLPCFVLFLTCIAGPLNGSIRYGLGFIASSPVILAATLDIARNTKNRGISQSSQ